MQYFGFDRPSFGIKTFGFGESGPKLQADFTTGTYKAGGATKTFADLFTFNRAGKAWLVKDTGLQEYAADVPRFDNGLLIEQSATNHAKDFTFPNDFYEFTKLDDGKIRVKCVKERIGSPAYYFVGGGTYPMAIDPTPYIGKYLRTSVLVHETNALFVLKTGRNNSIYRANYGVLSSGGEIVDVITLQFNLSLGSRTANPDPNTFMSSVGDYAIYSTPNYTLHDSPVAYSTPIKTSTTPVTRPADYLLNKITGTTVTGDWDSTLNLSIVNGQLVHSGYGRIRSLEIN